MELNVKIGEIIKFHRLEKKLSQEKLAGLAEIDRTYMQSIEKGERNISISTLLKIARALDIKMSKLLENLD
ncbi:helix-turn-helix transcriptional regulator [Flavobacterium sp.]|uniref:helix-turn-helix domain-containing protein n=1 Tax=Flavobacterium sp. TaxID=239 RepID=UPI0026025352|nr:helix-turn-helix transcriptional regulator [Flavobacterium sp.]